MDTVTISLQRYFSQRYLHSGFAGGKSWVTTSRARPDVEPRWGRFNAPTRGGSSLELPADSSIWTARAAVVLFGIGLFRLVALAYNNTDLYVDEAQYWDWAQEPAFGYFSKPPLIAWIISATTSVCGDGEFCVRLPSAVLYLATSAVIFLTARRLYSAEVGFWSAVAFATLPAVSVSSGIISTDVPLLLAWSIALYAFNELVAAPRLAMSLLLGLAIGVGLNAKYAMAYFVPCAAIYFWIVPEKRALLRKPHLWAALVFGLALILPNVAWNAAHSFATFTHTAENAAWNGTFFHPGNAAEFFLSQFGLFGPILFAGLIAIVWRTRGRLGALPTQDRLLIAFALPIIVAMIFQGFLSRANANWAAPAYVAATIVVIATLIGRRSWTRLRISFALHALAAIAVAIGTWQAGRWAFPRGIDPFARMLGNKETVAAVERMMLRLRAHGQPVHAVLTADRETAATLKYYGRGLDVSSYAWREGRPLSHFELTYPFTATTPTPILFVGQAPVTSTIVAHFHDVADLGIERVPAGAFATRTLHFTFLSEVQKK